MTETHSTLALIDERIAEMERSLQAWRERLAIATAQVQRHEGGLEELKKLRKKQHGHNESERTPSLD